MDFDRALNKEPAIANLDLLILAIYFIAVLGVGVYFMRRQSGLDEYLVGNRKIRASHLGLSVVATDVGGGFTVGLGGLGFAIGLSGSWMLFTGLLGAWLAAVFLIPRIKPLADQHAWRSFPDFLQHRYGHRARTMATVISGVGYAGFTGAQVLAGAKLVHGAFPEVDLTLAAILMGAIVIGYTAMGGLEAVVYTDSVQWVVLLVGLLFFGVPAAWSAVDGWQGLQQSVPPGHLDLFDVFRTSPSTVAVWLLTIAPIWFVAMTLYQRICAATDVKTAKRAWYLAGVLEWPTIAMLGTFLGLASRALYPEMDSEAAMPRMLADELPIGVTGLVLAAFFSAVMSTADSCLLAAVGHASHDIPAVQRLPEKKQLRLTRVLTLAIGGVSVAIALLSSNVLAAILGAYQVLVCGLFVPTVGGLYWRRGTALGAVCSIVIGGGWALLLIVFPGILGRLPGVLAEDPILSGLPISLVSYVAFSLLDRSRDQS